MTVSNLIFPNPKKLIDIPPAALSFRVGEDGPERILIAKRIPMFLEVPQLHFFGVVPQKDNIEKAAKIGIVLLWYHTVLRL
jgi:hypothetical protein